ncbi:MAG: chemotaxis protein CheX [Oceanospirillaceae bacterium]
MSNKFFGQYLLEEGVINEIQLLATTNLQKASYLSLGQIAIGKGYLTEEEALKINLEQQRTDQRYGALAISMGCLNTEQLSELFITQQNLRKFFGELLVDQKILSKTVLLEHLEAHAELKRQSTLQLDSAIYANVHGKLIADTINTTVRLFLRIAKTKVQVTSYQATDIVVGSQQLAFSQVVHIPEPLKIGLVLEDELMLMVANNFLNMDVSDNPAMCQDAVCEFLNIILGNALVGYNHHENTELTPSEISEAGYDLKPPYESVFCITMAGPNQSFSLFFYS